MADSKMRLNLFSVFLFNLLYSLTFALYFHIGETEKKCFIEEIPDETMIIGNYRTQLYDKQKEEYLPATQGLGMFVEVKDPDEKVILSRQYGSEGRFTFTSHTPGEHQICLHSNSSKFSLFAGGMLRVHLDIQVGEHTNNYAEIAAKDKLTELQLRVRQLVEQVDQIQKEQNYQRVSPTSIPLHKNDITCLCSISSLLLLRVVSRSSVHVYTSLCSGIISHFLQQIFWLSVLLLFTDPLRCFLHIHDFIYRFCCLSV
uniref:Transmembrane p24 trafficking protein 9 n=1 Tax=Scleropages formosus TaxID=113540 RepID=A0A8C9TP25_SCLFO